MEEKIGVFIEEYQQDWESRMVKALHKTIFENPDVPAKKIAKHLNIPYKTLSKMCREESLLPSMPKFPVVKLPKLAEIVDIEPIVDEVCFIGGFVPSTFMDIDVKHGQPSNPINVLKKTQTAAREMAKTTEEVIKALEDGVLTEEELEVLQTQINQLKKQIAGLEAFLGILNF